MSGAELDRPLFLVGFMGVGKTTAGRRLAREIGVEFLDLDQEIERLHGASIGKLFATVGEAQFRAIEREVLEGIVAARKPSVVAAGGGTPCHGGCMETMRRGGYTVYLYAAPDLLCARLAKNKSRRPLIASLGPEELERYVMRTIAEREPYYRQAHVTVDATALRSDTLMAILRMA